MENIIIALAGIFQSATLVHQVATYGDLEDILLESCIKTIFKLDSESVISIYENINTLQQGFNELNKIYCRLSETPKPDPRISQYVLSLIWQTENIRTNQSTLKKLRQSLEQLETQANYFNYTHEIVIANLADEYSALVQPYKHRIQIMGKADYLNNPKTMAKIRTLLLSGIRSAFLWRQLGGRRWQLFFCRRSYAKAIIALQEKYKLSILSER